MSDAVVARLLGKFVFNMVLQYELTNLPICPDPRMPRRLSRQFCWPSDL
jgi:hypothetical protein